MGLVELPWVTILVEHLGQVAKCSMRINTPYNPRPSHRFPAASSGLPLGGELAFLQTGRGPVAWLLPGQGLATHLPQLDLLPPRCTIE